jgi:hypothetical protein
VYFQFSLAAKFEYSLDIWNQSYSYIILLNDSSNKYSEKYVNFQYLIDHVHILVLALSSITKMSFYNDTFFKMSESQPMIQLFPEIFDASKSWST